MGAVGWGPETAFSAGERVVVRVAVCISTQRTGLHASSCCYVGWGCTVSQVAVIIVVIVVALVVHHSCCGSCLATRAGREGGFE